MHWIQRHALKQLTTKEGCRYKELKPEGVDGNLFMYHLNQLIAERHVEKKDSLYVLSKTGKKFVGGMSLATGNPTAAPRIFTMLYSKNEKGEILLYKWNRQPYLNHVSLPFSRIRYGQSLEQAAEENLKNKTNLTGKLTYLGLVNVVVKKGEEITTHYISHIYELKNPVGNPEADGLTGAPFWGKLKGQDLVDGTKEIIRILEKAEPPFVKEVVVEKSQVKVN